MWTRVLLCWLTLCCLASKSFSQDATTAASSAAAVSEGTLAQTIPQAAATTASAEGPGELTGILVDQVTQAPEGEQTTIQTKVLAQGAGAPTLDPNDTPIDGPDCGGDVNADVTCAPPPTGKPGGSTNAPGAGGGGGVTGGEGTARTTVTDAAAETTAGSEDATTGDSTTDGGSDGDKTTSENASTEGPGGKSTAEETTEGVTEQATTGLPPTTLRPWNESDPCHENNHQVLEDDERHYSKKGDEGSKALSDNELIPGWYAFRYEAQPAIITPTCIKEGQCTTIMTYHLYSGELPGIAETNQGQICGPGNVAGETNCCLKPVPIEIRNCQTHYIYKLDKLPLAAASICTQLVDETVPPVYRAIAPEEKTTTAVATTPRPTLPWLPHEDNDDGIVTIEYDFKERSQDYLIETFDEKFRAMIAAALNNLTFPEATTAAIVQPTQAAKEVTVITDIGNSAPKGGSAETPEVKKPPVVPDVDTDAGPIGPEDVRRKRRETNDHVYTDHDVKYVGMTPTISEGGTLQVPIYTDDPDTERVSTAKMMAALKDLEDSGEISDEVGAPMIRYYEGLPQGLSEVGRRTDAGMWERHRDLLIALIVLISICLIVILIGLLCLRCRKSRSGSWSRDDKVAMEAGNGHGKKKRPHSHMVVENPMSDNEILRDEQAPMTERENPAVTSNGGGSHLSKKDDDNSWVYPLEDAPKADFDQHPVADTRL